MIGNLQPTSRSNMVVSYPYVTAGYKIGEAAARSGVSAANIRFYEKEQLLQAQGRSDNSYRMYNDSDIHQLKFIRACRALDMSLDEVRTLLGLNLNSKADCATARGAGILCRRAPGRGGRRASRPCRSRRSWNVRVQPAGAGVPRSPASRHEVRLKDSRAFPAA